MSKNPESIKNFSADDPEEGSPSKSIEHLENLARSNEYYSLVEKTWQIIQHSLRVEQFDMHTFWLPDDIKQILALEKNVDIKHLEVELHQTRDRDNWSVCLSFKVDNRTIAMDIGPDDLDFSIEDQEGFCEEYQVEPDNGIMLLLNFYHSLSGFNKSEFREITDLVDDPDTPYDDKYALLLRYIAFSKGQYVVTKSTPAFKLSPDRAVRLFDTRSETKKLVGTSVVIQTAKDKDGLLLIDEYQYLNYDGTHVGSHSLNETNLTSANLRLSNSYITEDSLEAFILGCDEESGAELIEPFQGDDKWRKLASVAKNTIKLADNF